VRRRAETKRFGVRLMMKFDYFQAQEIPDSCHIPTTEQRSSACIERWLNVFIAPFQ
jgi:hypothetical protein